MTHLFHYSLYRCTSTSGRSTVMAFADVAASFGDVLVLDCPLPQQEVSGSSSLRTIGVSGMLSTTTVRTGIRHLVIEVPVEGRDTAVPRFLFRADVVRGVAVSRQVSRPVTIDAGTAIGGSLDRAAGASNRAAARNR